MVKTVIKDGNYKPENSDKIIGFENSTDSKERFKRVERNLENVHLFKDHGNRQFKRSSLGVLRKRMHVC